MISRSLNICEGQGALRTIILFVVCGGLAGTANAEGETSPHSTVLQTQLASNAFQPNSGPKERVGESGQAREYLETILYTRKEVEEWTSGRILPYGKTYDSFLGWVHADARIRDVIDGSIVTYSHSGPRRMSMYADKPCRINTYGNSYTHCDQV